MDFHDFEEERRFREVWDAVRVERAVHYSLFTFGESVLPYYLVCAAVELGQSVSLTKGEVRITRPTIITPESAHPQFRNFFEEQENDDIVEFLLARSAAFSHLKFDNNSGPAQFLSDSVEEIVARLNRELDAQEEEQVAILSAPKELAGVAILKYASERVWASAPDNVQELRERGFLP